MYMAFYFLFLFELMVFFFIYNSVKHRADKEYTETKMGTETIMKKHHCSYKIIR